MSQKMTEKELHKKQRLCTHVVLAITEPPYRYQCMKCGKKQKILSGVLIREAAKS